MTVDVEGPINRILAGAERRFDAHIRDLSPPPPPSPTDGMTEAERIGYVYGSMNRALRELAEGLTRGFALGNRG